MSDDTIIFVLRESRREEFCTFEAILSIEKTLLYTSCVKDVDPIKNDPNNFRAVLSDAVMKS